MPDRPDPLTDVLARFTPVPGLDRDALMFEAGRRTARPWRVRVVAGLLAVSNVVLVLALGMRDSSPVLPPTPAPPPAAEFVLPSPPPSDVWSAGSPPDVLASPPPPLDGEFVAAGPPLSVRSNVPFE